MFCVLLPPLEAQQRIVAKVDQLMALCDQLEAKLAQTQTDGGRVWCIMCWRYLLNRKWIFNSLLKNKLS
jgi:hypothetical protein